MKSSFRLLPDIPWGESIISPKSAQESDGLSFHHYADILARAALDTPEPFTIGIYGGWGSGKTSLMRMMEKIVEDEPGAVPVWFNAWRYEKEEYLIIPLLATIVSTMKDYQSKWETMKEAGNNLVSAFRSVLYGISVKGKIGIPGIAEAELGLSPENMIRRYQEITADTLLEKSLYFHAFDKLDKIVKDSKGPRLVIFVDDLDRCFPDKAVYLLEGIKLVLNQPNITFVLGISPYIIQAYLKNKYKKEYNVPEELYEDYLEKLVQLAFRVPEISESVEDYVSELLKREDVFGYISASEFQERYAPLVAICGPACKDNPRAIIRFLNRLLIMKKMHESREKTGKEEGPLPISLVHFGITNALDLKWPKILKFCERNPKIHLDDNETKELCIYLSETLQKYPKEDQDNTLVHIALITRPVFLRITGAEYVGWGLCPTKINGVGGAQAPPYIITC